MAYNKNKLQNQGDRIHILSKKEYENLYGLPKFSNEAKILFVLQLGYF